MDFNLKIESIRKKRNNLKQTRGSFKYSCITVAAAATATAAHAQRKESRPNKQSCELKFNYTNDTVITACGHEPACHLENKNPSNNR